MPKADREITTPLAVSQVMSWIGRSALGLFISAGAIALGYAVAGHTAIDVLYDGSTGTWLDGIIVGQQRHPVEHYYALADARVLKVSVAMGLLAWGLLALSCAASTRVLVLFLATDLVFLLLECLYGFTAGLPLSDWWLGRDWGYAEMFQYAKELGIVVVFFLFFLRHPHVLTLGWQLLFLYLLLDDSQQIHERVGVFVGGLLDTSWVFTDHVASAFFGSVILGLLSLGYRSAPAWMREVSWPLLGLVVALAVFGVVLDTLHQVVDRSMPILFKIGYPVEEAGEMVSISLIAWYVHRLATARDHGRHGSTRAVLVSHR